MATMWAASSASSNEALHRPSTWRTQGRGRVAGPRSARLVRAGHQQACRRAPGSVQGLRGRFEAAVAVMLVVIDSERDETIGVLQLHGVETADQPRDLAAQVVPVLLRG